MNPRVAALLAGVLLLSACVTEPTRPTRAALPKADLHFVDLQGFDQEIATSLGAPLPKVDVDFYDRISPSAIPERLQLWLASVAEGGGTVKVTQPKAVGATRNPFLLISAASTLWSATQAVKEISTKHQFKVAQAYDAEIILKLDDKGNTLVDKIVFLKRDK